MSSDFGGQDREPPILEEVYFVRRARVSLGDLWMELADWAPTIATGTVVLVLPYVLSRLVDGANASSLYNGVTFSWIGKDPVMRAAAVIALVLLLVLWVYKIFHLILERRGRVVRMDLHEIECWPDGKSRFLLVRDVLGAQVGRTERRSRWWVLRRARKQVVLFVKRPADGGIERLRFDLSRHELLTESVNSGIAELSQGQDGNRVAIDVIALLRRRRVELSLAVEELPEADFDITGDSMVRLVGNRDEMVLHAPGKSVTIPGWAVRSAQVMKSSRKDPRAPLTLALELDPRCGEFHIQVGLGKGKNDEQIVQWCQLLAARFDKGADLRNSRS